MAPYTYTRGRKRIIEGKEEKSSKDESKVDVVGRHGSSSSSSSSSPVKEKPNKRPRPTKLRWLCDDEEQALKYSKQVQESEGFDVDDFGDFESYCMIRPIKKVKKHSRLLGNLSNRALKHYKENVDKDATFNLVEIVKANVNGGRYWEYYITFDAADNDNDQVKTFQAKVVADYVGCETFDVEFCRLKPTPTL